MQRAYIFRTSFVLDGVRTFCLFDDMMISMTFARNLAGGHGLVWNVGEAPVEGFTNPLWVLFMAAFHLLPVSLAKMSLPIQVAGALLLGLNLNLVRKICGEVAPDKTWVAAIAVVFTAIYLPLNTFGLQGTEVSVLVCITSLAVLWAVRAYREQRFSLPLHVLLGVGTLVRPDMVVVYGSVVLFLVLADKTHRWRNFWTAAALLSLFVGLQTGLRLWYYGELLPNTYYLKVTGYPTHLRWTRGLWITWQFIVNMSVLFPVALGAVFLKSARGLGLLAFVFGIQHLYSVYVGGDAWEWWGSGNRYICLAMPCFFVLLSTSLVGLRERFGAGWGARLASGLVLGFALVQINSIRGVSVIDNALSLVRDGRLDEKSALNELLWQKPPMHQRENERHVDFAGFLCSVSKNEARIAVVWAGALPYFCERTYLDLLGKNDKYIARMEMRAQPDLPWWRNFYPGHMKFDFDYSIGQLKPDIIAKVWIVFWEEQFRVMQSAGYEPIAIPGYSSEYDRMYFLRDPPNILWE